MNRANLILLIILLFTCINIAAIDLESTLPEMDDVRFKLLPCVQHNLRVNAGNMDSGLYFIDDITVAKSDFLSKGMSVFLNADMLLSEVLVNGQSIYAKQYTYVKAENFDPIIRLQAYTELVNKTNLTEILFKDKACLPDTFIIKFKYLLLLADSLKTTTFKNGVLTLSGNSFWYPRNLNYDENVKLTIKSTDRVKVALGSNDQEFKQEGYLRVSEINLIDMMEHPVDISFKRD